MSNTQTVLVVDDDPAFVKATQLLLEGNGFRVDTARGGRDALVQIDHSTPDLVLLDVMMDVPLDGLYVSEMLLSQPHLRKIPIIMMSSITDTEYAAIFPTDRYLHMDRWLDKPCPPDRLVAEIKSVLAAYQRR